VAPGRWRGRWALSLLSAEVEGFFAVFDGLILLAPSLRRRACSVSSSLT